MRIALDTQRELYGVHADAAVTALERLLRDRRAELVELGEQRAFATVGVHEYGDSTYWLDPARLDAALRGAAAEFDFDWQLHPLSSPVRTLIMVSRAGHCLNDLLYRHRAGRLPIEPVRTTG